MKRRAPTTQDISWLLDLDRNEQLDLDPSYQRRSVWTRSDRLFFLDTIFRGYPSPAIFLHKAISESGRTTYHVVDGKQRLETILRFAAGKLRLRSDFGDERLNGKTWKELGVDERHDFWNYSLPVEFLDRIDGKIVNEVFDRLNRNAKKLTRQELRHARFEGWFVNLAEEEAKGEDWQQLGVVTTARVRRMADVQSISDLLLVVLEGSVLGFDQDALDDMYAKYDPVSEIENAPDVLRAPVEELDAQIKAAKALALGMSADPDARKQLGRKMGHFYTLWCVLVLASDELPEPEQLGKRYRDFMALVEHLEALERKKQLGEALKSDDEATKNAVVYWTNMRGASTELRQRSARYEALRKELA